jgi:AcrR family transcriptional regulator
LIASPTVPLAPSEPVPATPAPRRSRRKEARPGELLDAALDLFVTKGYAATKVEEVARLAGVSKGTLFLYFPSKQELFQAVVRHVLSSRFAEWDLELDSYEHNTATLIHYCYEVWWQRIGSTKACGLPHLVMAEAHNFPEIAAFYRQEVVLPGNRLIERVLRRGMARGELAPLDLDYGVTLVLAPLIFCASVKSTGGICLPDPDFDIPRFLRLQADALMHGLGGKPPGAAA